MSDTPNDPLAPPPVRDKRTPPSGLLPKNTQGWILAGIALLMVTVIMFSGRNAPKEKSSSTAPQAAPVDPNAARIQEYQRRIEEEAQKLRLEQAQLARSRASLGALPNTPAASNAMPYPGQTYSQSAGLRYAGAEPNVDGNFEADRKKREYQSLFASNVALSYRKEAAPAQPSPAAPAADSLAKALALYASLVPATASAGPAALAAPPALTAQAAPPKNDSPGIGSTPAKEADDRSAKARAAARDAELDRAEGKQYRLFEGTVFETVLTNRLDGSFSGPVNCMVTTNVYSHNGQRLLIPQGSRVLGEVRKVETFGQERLAVVFHRLIMPDGYSVSLDKFQGLNQIGETGLKDQVNHHYLQVFGVSLAIGSIAGLSQANTRYGIDESAADAYRQGVATSLSQSSMRILDRYLNVLPTFTIREGHRVKIYLSDDLLLPAYDKHQMPGDL
jgi:type IV secretory pathway VirB10-like protein